MKTVCHLALAFQLRASTSQKDRGSQPIQEKVQFGPAAYVIGGRLISSVAAVSARRRLNRAPRYIYTEPRRAISNGAVAYGAVVLGVPRLRRRNAVGLPQLVVFQMFPSSTEELSILSSVNFAYSRTMLGKRLSSSGGPLQPSKRQATSSPEEGELDDDPSLALPPLLCSRVVRMPKRVKFPFMAGGLLSATSAAPHGLGLPRATMP
ncbi:hypothetical protein M422DRAFT_244075 [Sphaerobolus stellatus SS14]|nr:hypothetical protein M422DRAFT_244075 [Sphaerobolus stellatus SS14]